MCKTKFRFCVKLTQTTDSGYEKVLIKIYFDLLFFAFLINILRNGTLIGARSVTDPAPIRLAGSAQVGPLASSALLSTQSGAFSFFAIHIDTVFLLVMLCITPFAKTSENENKVESKGILKISRLVSNYFNKVSKKWRIKCTRC